MSWTFSIGLPQAIYIALAVLGFWNVAKNHGRSRVYDLRQLLVGEVITVTLLVWGGFFGGRG